MSKQINILEVFCPCIENSTSEHLRIHFFSINEFCYPVGSIGHSTDFYVVGYCKDCASLESKNIHNKTYVRCSECQKKMTLYGDFFYNDDSAENIEKDYWLENTNKEQETTLKESLPMDFEVTALELDELGNYKEPREKLSDRDFYILHLTDQYCPRCGQDSLCFQHNRSIPFLTVLDYLDTGTIPK